MVYKPSINLIAKDTEEIALQRDINTHDNTKSRACWHIPANVEMYNESAGRGHSPTQTRVLLNDRARYEAASPRDSQGYRSVSGYQTIASLPIRPELRHCGQLHPGQVHQKATALVQPPRGRTDRGTLFLNAKQTDGSSHSRPWQSRVLRVVIGGLGFKAEGEIMMASAFSWVDEGDIVQRAQRLKCIN
ncbi:hypothetical protein DPEC_G00113910 [Dallia pectoralis]|uniref:Uncharacterized protein n=1 Tax=Dallia pectoralis TaxID=75939 RepID=A0ACC2GUD9_DALPE|nr:hypothetical protein DPEC_G00113910 [Dallia pectoralis]